MLTIPGGPQWRKDMQEGLRILTDANLRFSREFSLTVHALRNRMDDLDKRIQDMEKKIPQ